MPPVLQTLFVPDYLFVMSCTQCVSASTYFHRGTFAPTLSDRSIDPKCEACSSRRVGSTWLTIIKHDHPPYMSRNQVKRLFYSRNLSSKIKGILYCKYQRSGIEVVLSTSGQHRPSLLSYSHALFSSAGGCDSASRCRYSRSKLRWRIASYHQQAGNRKSWEIIVVNN